MKTLIPVALCIALSSVSVSTQLTPTSDEVAKVISRVKQTEASRLDSSLPSTTLEKWLFVQVGADADVGWVVRTGEQSGQDLPWVEADISIRRVPSIVVVIATGTSESAELKFHSLQLVRKDEYAAWPRLRDLPAAMKRARESVLAARLTPVGPSRARAKGL